MRPLIALSLSALAALTFAACGSEGNELSESDPLYAGSVLFAERCSGCHTLSVVGSQGSGNRALRAQGPNFDQRIETYEDVLFAIQNGGFSGAIMPQNIVVGEQAEAVSEFLAEYAGSDVDDPLRPEPDPAAVGDQPSAAEEAAEDAESADSE